MNRRTAVVVGMLLAVGFLAFKILDIHRDKARATRRFVYINQTDDHRFDDSIKATISANQARAGIQNAVLIARELPAGQSIESWAAELYKKLELGRSTQGKAILYVFVPSRKLLKIEVGYALEGILPDALVHSLEEAAKSFTYVDRMHDFWSDMINTINVEAHNRDHAMSGYDFSNWKYLSGGAGIVNGSYDFSAKRLQREFATLSPGDSSYSPSKDLQVSFERYMLSLKDGIGDPALPLLSTGSRVYRRYSPQNKALSQRLWRMYQEAMPVLQMVSGERAIIRFQKNHPVLPIYFFRNSKGLWLVHEPYSYSVFNRFEDSMDIFQTQPIDASAKEFASELNSHVIYFGALPYKPQPLDGAEFFAQLTQLERNAQSGSAIDLFALGDFYYFETWLFEKAATLYQKAIAREAKPEYLFRYLTPLMLSGHLKEFVGIYDRLAKLKPNDQMIRSNFEFYRREFSFPDADWQTHL